MRCWREVVVEPRGAMSFHRPARRSAASLLGLCALALALLPAAPAAAGELLSIRVSPKVVSVGDSLTVTGRAGPSRDIFEYHAASIFVVRPGVACPRRTLMFDDYVVLGSEFYWSFSFAEQPRPIRVLIERPSAVGIANVCTYVRGENLEGGMTVDPPPGPTATVRIAASPRAWERVVRVRSTELQRRTGSVPVRVACDVDAPPPACTGTVRLRGGRTILGQRDFSIAPGRTGTVAVALTTKGDAIVGRRGQQQVSLDLIPARGVLVTRRVPLRR
jgi:hypothetical protein